MRRVYGLIAIILLATGAATAQTGLTGGRDGLSRSRGTEKRVASRTEVVRARGVGGRVLQLGPTGTYLKEGLSIGEVVRFLGQPISVRERREGDSRRATYIFNGIRERVLVAEFTDGLLVRSLTSTRDELAQAEKTKQ
jgi:hypothetical protein